MAKRSMFVGMDVHKESIDVSLAEEGRDGEVRHYGVIPGDLEAVAKVVRALRAPSRRLRFVYEAGPCGFGIHRYLTAQGEDCVVVNPSSMPKRSGDRIKTDRRDGDALARLHRAGELTAIYIPTPDDEALRDLVRAREDAVGLSTQAKHRLKAFLLRQGRRYPGRAGWTRPYRRWLADLSFPLAPQHIALQEYRDTIDETERRVERLTDQLRQLTPAWRWAPVVDALQALRGVSFVTAVGLVAEVGDIRRVHASARADGVSRPRAVGVFQWAERPPRRDHQGRQSARAALARRSGVGVSGRAAHRTADALPARSVAEDRLRHRVEGATPPDVALSQAGRARQGETQGRHRDRARAHGLHLGDRAGGAAAARVSRRGDQVRQAGGIAARWRTLEDVMDISTIDTSVPRARQLRDEPQSGRYPTRGYQQRQPSLERGAADQTDLKNEEHGKSVLRKGLTTVRRERSAHLTESSHINVRVAGVWD